MFLRHCCTRRKGSTLFSIIHALCLICFACISLSIVFIVIWDIIMLRYILCFWVCIVYGYVYMYRQHIYGSILFSFHFMHFILLFFFSICQSLPSFGWCFCVRVVCVVRVSCVSRQFQSCCALHATYSAAVRVARVYSIYYARLVEFRKLIALPRSESKTVKYI